MKKRRSEEDEEEEEEEEERKMPKQTAGAAVSPKRREDGQAVSRSQRIPETTLTLAQRALLGVGGDACEGCVEPERWIMTVCARGPRLCVRACMCE
ncbi:unnamed protein product [Pleuronectes platessa]|uniref:Uncharacterized protein n=1 Tax=Pleuronectes platessa TaxID=8262 RepID=A0A9N7VJ70_PLEPL|nr:unnamed protein product [Pleuronectes platessa]